MSKGVWPAQSIDHINGVKSDNRISNLRLATKSQQSFNKPPGRRNGSGVVGVAWNKDCRKWQARLCAGGKNHSFGLHACLGLAVKARKIAEKQFCGEFARDNK